jgi:hypothetical protein
MPRPGDSSPQPITRPRRPDADVDELRLLLKDLALFFDSPGTGTVAFEADEYFGFQDAAGWLSDTLAGYAARRGRSMATYPPSDIPAQD